MSCDEAGAPRAPKRHVLRKHKDNNDNIWPTFGGPLGGPQGVKIKPLGLILGRGGLGNSIFQNVFQKHLLVFYFNERVLFWGAARPFPGNCSAILAEKSRGNGREAI